MSEGPAQLQLIVAMSENRCIGKDNALPWHISEDLKRFKRLTKGHAIIMGRKTHESIGRALPHRRNIVITRRPDAHFEGCEVAGTVAEAIALAREGDPAPFVVGGASVYEAALPKTTRIHLTEVKRTVDGDTFMPPFPPSEWEVVAEEDGEDPEVRFVTLERKNP
ncbi:MAG: dihydrofolate reductase [Deltaproteobacteria bacterium]|nr:dihydrofolate reductase [Deltaproteobacteria bacterium]